MNSSESVMALARPWACPPLRNVPILGDQYTSREFFDREWSSMWTKVWLLMGRYSELGEAGSYQMEEVGPLTKQKISLTKVLTQQKMQ